jgi:hypothetical protein
MYSTVEMAQRCGAVLSALEANTLKDPSLFQRTRAAFNGYSIEGAREQLGEIVQQASQETAAVQALIRELHAIVTVFNQQVGPILQMEDRRQRFDQFKAWMGLAESKGTPA